MQDSLANRISKRLELTEGEITSGVALLGDHCRARTKARLYWALKACPNMHSYGIYDRLHIENGAMSYCAGQSYPDEIRTVRELLIGR